MPVSYAVPFDWASYGRQQGASACHVTLRDTGAVGNITRQQVEIPSNVPSQQVLAYQRGFREGWYNYVGSIPVRRPARLANGRNGRSSTSTSPAGRDTRNRSTSTERRLGIHGGSAPAPNPHFQRGHDAGYAGQVFNPPQPEDGRDYNWYRQGFSQGQADAAADRARARN